jgi:hypothetical protein
MCMSLGQIQVLKIPMMDETTIKIVRFHDLMLFTISFFTFDAHFFFFSHFYVLLIMIFLLCVVAPIIVI